MNVFQAHKKAVRSLAFSPDGSRLATTGDEEAIKLWEPPASGPLLSRDHGGRFSLTFSPDGRQLAWAGGGSYVYDLESRSFDFESYSANSIVCCFSPDGKVLFAQGYALPLRRWETSHWSELPADWGKERGSSFYPHPIGTLACHPDGGTVAVVYSAHDPDTREYLCDIQLLDSETGERRGAIRTSSGDLLKLAFSPDGRLLAAAINTQVRVWRVADGVEVIILRAGRKHFQDLAFTPDGSRLVTVSNDETARLWETKTWKAVAGYEWQVGKLGCVAVSPDGMRMAAGGDSGKVVIWDVD